MTDTLASIEAGSTSGSEKRRSSRVPLAVPITVSGVDALGEPFRELTTTLSVSCNGCKYKSKNYVQRDSLVTLEVMHPNPRLSSRVVKGRARWVQRPRNLREQYEIGLEFIVSGNVWGLQSPPPDWFPHPDDEALLKEQQENVAAVAQELVAEIAAPEGANFKTLDEALEAAAATPPIPTVTYEEIDISGAVGFMPQESAPADLNARLQETIATSLKTMMNHIAEEAAERIAARIASAIDEARTACGLATDEFEEKIRETLEVALSPEELDAQTASAQKQAKKRARKAAKKKARQASNAETDSR
ncbi:MAG: PilZ domain-containing protein [Candidatus Acidiferrales bacterium]